MNAIEFSNALGKINDKYVTEAAIYGCKGQGITASKTLKRRFPAALIAAVIMALALTTVAAAAYLYHVYITNRDTELPSYEVTAELEEQTISMDALEELKVKHIYKENYTEVANYLDVDLLISERLDSAVLGNGVDIQGSYVKGERPITSITLSSRHNTGPTISGYIDMLVYMSTGTKNPYEQITQILNPELSEKEAVLSEYVSEANGIDAKFAVYETIGYASAYFVDNGIFYSISIGGFAKEDNVDLAEYLKDLINTFE